MTWAAISEKDYRVSSVVKAREQLHAQETIYALKADDKTVEDELFEEAVKTDGLKYHPGYVARWHVRHIPGHGYFLSPMPWETHPQYTGPADFLMWVYRPSAAEEGLRRQWEAREAERKKKHEEAKAAKAAAQTPEATA